MRTKEQAIAELGKAIIDRAIAKAEKYPDQAEVFANEAKARLMILKRDPEWCLDVEGYTYQ